MASHMTEDDDTVKKERCIKKERSVVPWYNAEQFLKVYDCLYSQELKKKRWAIDQMSVWDSRCHPSLPTAIEASLALSRAIIQDALFTNEASLCHEKDIQMLYSMALVRFVNLSIELHQSNEKQHTAHIARGLGIPTWVVDLRNEAAHSMTPSLPVLRIGAEAAMKYLEEAFWSIESKRMKDFVKEPVDIQKLKELILHYQVIQFKLFRHINTESEQYQSDKEEILHTLQQLVQCLNQNREKFLEVLVMDGFFITAEEDLKFLLTQKELSNFSVKKTDKSDSDDENEASTQPELPSTLEKFWQPLLRKLNDFGAIPEFVEVLLNTLGQRNLIGKKLIASWVIKILRFAMNPCLENNTLTEMFRHKGPLFNWNRLMYAAVSNPCIYTAFILPLIICHLDLKKEFIRSVMTLIAIAQGQAVDRNHGFLKGRTAAFTLDELKQNVKMQNLKLKRKRKGKEKRNVWSVAPEHFDFKNLPMGAVFKSSSEEEGPMIESIYQMYYTNEVKYRWTLELNKNDTEDMEGIVTVEQDTFEEEDEHILEEKYAYLYKKKTS